ncbi:hypothetical protein PVBG_06387 [Plasmodium vivax Brazil I]|uniref:Pv-fam-c protein n=1 Tax=Plasmodium vivax (strain Brazil I) TaxID=1033975 RepID=A0A0J9T1C7_PLAV1|nr:hypothetical protein PVBG_06387 [Plasmodium vivax Brazil I]
MKHLKEENIRLIQIWLDNFEQNLKKYLNHVSAKMAKINTDIHCRDLNYILDAILERIFESKRIEHVKWQHYVQEPSLKLLNNVFTNLKCPRNTYDFNNKFIHIKKHMHDLCEDIAYIINEKTKIHKNSDCKDIISRVSERREKLRKVYHTNQYHSVFDFDKKCTIDYIMNKFSGNECEIVDKPPNAMEPTDNILNQQTEQVPDPDPDPEAEPEQEDDVDLSVTEVTDLEMDLQLPPGEEPKLDTTYAAASLCGVSLIGAMIYKVK